MRCQKEKKEEIISLFSDLKCTLYAIGYRASSSKLLVVSFGFWSLCNLTLLIIILCRLVDWIHSYWIVCTMKRPIELTSSQFMEHQPTIPLKYKIRSECPITLLLLLQFRWILWLSNHQPILLVLIRLLFMPSHSHLWGLGHQILLLTWVLDHILLLLLTIHNMLLILLGIQDFCDVCNAIWFGCIRFW